MAITEKDVARIARLARIELSPDESTRAQNELNGILSLIHQDIALRLRPDTASPTRTLQERQALMANTPAEDNGLFLVPTVIE
jgi:aspartyl-tRNA(Asn)/glutamyl-tRNA(Gln) amidotransferase subunit C